MITANSQVVNVLPRITADQFETILSAASSPALVESQAAYEAIVALKVDPAVLLAIFFQESRYATDPKSMVVKYSTFNPGNCRSSTIGPQEIIQTERGAFVRYKNWADGFRDAANRLIEPGFAYALASADTIGEIIPIWAPGTDGNDPAGYVQTVISLMNKWISQGGSNMDLDYYNLNIIDKTGQLVYDGKTGSRGGYAIKEVVLHETAGPSDSKNATGALAVQLDNNTLNWFLKTDNQLSIHYFIGGENTGAPVYRCCPENIMAYHAIGNKGVAAGGSVDNHISIGIERMGQPNDGPVGPKQTAALCKLALDICRRNKLTTDQIVSHASIQSDKRDGNTLLAVVKKYVGDNLGVNHVDNTEPSKPAVVTYPTGKSLAHGFKDFYDRLAAAGPNLELLTLGYPITNEFDLPLGGQTRTVQLFERAGLVYEGASPSPWDIHTLTLSELAQALDVAKSRALLN